MYLRLYRTAGTVDAKAYVQEVSLTRVLDFDVVVYDGYAQTLVLCNRFVVWRRYRTCEKDKYASIYLCGSVQNH